MPEEKKSIWTKDWRKSINENTRTFLFGKREKGQFSKEHPVLMRILAILIFILILLSYILRS